MNGSTVVASMNSVTVNSSGKFVAVGYDGNNYPVFATSTDGSTWTTPVLMNGSTVVASMNSVTVNSSGKFVAVGYDGNNYPVFATSTDGSTWTTPALMNGSTVIAPMNSVTVNSSGMFVAVGRDYYKYPVFATSTDGSTWTTPVLMNGSTVIASMNSVTVNSSGKFVAVGYDGNNYPVFATLPTTPLILGKGGMVWIKNRTGDQDNELIDTVRGATKSFVSNAGFADSTYPDDFLSFNSNGFSLGISNNVPLNNSGENYASWTFAQSSKFFKVAQVTVSGGVTATVDLSSLGTVGMIIVKRTDSTSNRYVFHRSCTSGKLVYLHTTAAETTDGSITVSGTTLSLIGGVIANGTYIVYAWAHDTSADGMIQCGSFTTDGSGNATVNLGWEPQYILMKCSSGLSNWFVADTSRAFPTSQAANPLYPNITSAETIGTLGVAPTATGLNITYQASSTSIYMAIRRPMKVPTVGAQVYNAIVRTGTGTAATVTGVGFAPDYAMSKRRDGTGYAAVFDRLRGTGRRLIPQTTDAEANDSVNTLTAFNMDGISVWDVATGPINISGYKYINHFFKRAPKFFDIVCYTGTGRTNLVTHNLGVIPELVITKSRSTSYTWEVNTPIIGIFATLNTTDAGFAYALPATSSTINVGSNASNNPSTLNVAYLFATLAGVSKVGSYTGNGGTQTINCGFVSGARFVLCKAVSTTGNWIVGDSTRGMTSGNDPALYLNSTSAEIIVDDWLDPESTGFIVNETSVIHANTNGVQYIYLAFS